MKRHSFGNTGLRAKAKKAKREEPIENLHVSSTMERAQVLKMVIAAKGVGAACGSEILVGFNSIMRAMERGGIVAVCLTRDSPYNKPFVEAALAKGVALVILPSFTDEMGKVLGIRRASCMAILDPNSTLKALQSRLQAQQMSQPDQETLLGHIDALREYLLGLGVANLKFV